MKIAIVDTYYPEFLRFVEPHRPLGASYSRTLRWMMEHCFGTFDAYSRGLTALGWETLDIIANSKMLDQLWRLEYGPRVGNVALAQIDRFNPDVVFCQDLNVFPQQHLMTLGEDYFLAGQLSCPWPGDHIVQEFDILFTSFPHYLPRFVDLGVKAVFLPLAFDPEVHHRLMERFYVVSSGPRKLDVSFVGGLSPQFGDRTKVLTHALAMLGDTVQVHGYGNSGGIGSEPRWGLDMYKLYSESKIVLNIHHPASEGFSNNLRMFEATGMGALLLTEYSPNIEDYFIPGKECATYRSAEEAVSMIKELLKYDGIRAEIAAAGQQRTLTSHTYNNRMPTVDTALRELIL